MKGTWEVLEDCHQMPKVHEEKKVVGVIEGNPTIPSRIKG